MKDRWTDEDRQRYADRDILRSRRRPARRAKPPSPDEWR